jgi:hypothetical protein
MIRELVGNNPKVEGMNPYSALNLLLEAYAPGKAKKKEAQEAEQSATDKKDKKGGKGHH